MNSLKAQRDAQWREWAEKFAALSRRERGIIAAAVVLGGSFLLFNFAVEPLQMKAKLAARSFASAQAELTRQQALLAALTAQDADPDVSNRQRLAQVKQQLGKVGAQLAGFEAGMVPPSQMQAFLESLLARNRNVELLGLKTLPATPLSSLVAADKKSATGVSASVPKDVSGKDAAPAEDIYRHGVEVRLAGSYNDLLNYLADLEHMPQRVMWDSVSLTVKKYPRNELVLRVYTLSLDSNWLVV